MGSFALACGFGVYGLGFGFRVLGLWCSVYGVCCSKLGFSDLFSISLCQGPGNPNKLFRKGRALGRTLEAGFCV